MKCKRLIVFSVTGGLCLLTGLAVRSCFAPPKPWKVGSVVVRDRQITITLWAGSKQEAIIQPYDGVYRILEIRMPDQSPAFFDLPDTITADGSRMEVYWYATNNVIRFKDTAFATFAREFRSECLL